MSVQFCFSFCKKGVSNHFAFPFFRFFVFSRRQTRKSLLGSLRNENYASLKFCYSDESEPKFVFASPIPFVSFHRLCGLSSERGQRFIQELRSYPRDMSLYRMVPSVCMCRLRSYFPSETTTVPPQARISIFQARGDHHQTRTCTYH